VTITGIGETASVSLSAFFRPIGRRSWVEEADRRASRVFFLCLPGGVWGGGHGSEGEEGKLEERTIAAAQGRKEYIGAWSVVVLRIY